MLIFVIQEKIIFISVIRDPLFFPFVNCARDFSCATLLEELPLHAVTCICNFFGKGLGST